MRPRSGGKRGESDGLKGLNFFVFVFFEWVFIYLLFFLRNNFEHDFGKVFYIK